MSTVLANPAKMIERGAPRVIRTDEELEQYTNALFRLTAMEKPSASESEAIELLTILVERYEHEHYRIPQADPVSVVRSLIENQGLSQRDLIPEFGSESAVSMFLAGKRRLSLKQVQKLAVRFRLPADVFLATDSDKGTQRIKLSDRRLRIEVPPKGRNLAMRQAAKSAR